MKRFLRWISEPLNAVKIPTSVRFPIDSELEYRQRVSRASLPANAVKADRNQPDYPIG